MSTKRNIYIAMNYLLHKLINKVEENAHINRKYLLRNEFTTIAALDLEQMKCLLLILALLFIAVNLNTITN
ncbi:hypothetical protein T09_5193 [Trichinella sp. T9]|nr:hypothetical protein T09_5193 [Trichinella sp. T9]